MARRSITALQWSLTMLAACGFIVFLYLIGQNEWVWMDIPMTWIGGAFFVLAAIGFTIVYIQRRRR